VSRLRVGTALTEGTANFLVNRRMNKSQQMRWSRRGADRLLQVRCAVYNGTLGTGFGQRFYAANDAAPASGCRSLTPNLATVPRATPAPRLAAVMASGYTVGDIMDAGDLDIPTVRPCPSQHRAPLGFEREG
jgi:hypothetical protein